MEDGLRIVGEVRWILKDKNGEIKEEGKTNNLVVTEGDEKCADAICTTPAIPQMAYIILGTGGVTPEKTFTWVQTGYAGNGKALDATYPKLKVADAKSVEYQATFGPGSGTQNGIDECVISTVDAEVDGSEPVTSKIMAYAHLSPEKNKGADDSLVILWTISFLGA